MKSMNFMNLRLTCDVKCVRAVWVNLLFSLTVDTADVYKEPLVKAPIKAWNPA